MTSDGGPGWRVKMFSISRGVLVSSCGSGVMVSSFRVGGGDVELLQGVQDVQS